MQILDDSRSKADLKSYGLITLDCGLEVLMIDSTAEIISRGDTSNPKAAAGLSVGVGSFSDPEELQGLAHFLEHMIFMGSIKYPGENEYSAFVAENGGGCNAYTEAEATVYQFDVTVSHFHKALDIFANCFYSPLLNMEAIERELKSIDSEFNLAKCTDSNRLHQCVCGLAKKGHILRKFSWGNYQSLKTRPHKSGVDTYALLRAFYLKHYLPKSMKLVVMVPKPLIEIQKDIENSFGHWENEFPIICSPTPVPSDTIHSSKLKSQNEYLKTMDMPFSLSSSSDIGHLTRIVPLKKGHKLELIWQIPPQKKLYRTRPCRYLSHLCGHEGPGSLLSGLKRFGLALEVVSGETQESLSSNSVFSMFSISVIMTAKGMCNWPLVVRLVLDYCRMLRVEGPQKWVWEECAKIERLNFDFQEPDEPDEIVSMLAESMADLNQIKREHLLQEDLMFDWDENAVNDLLSSLQIINAHVILSSSAFQAMDIANEADDDSNQWEDESNSSDGEAYDDEDDNEDDFDSGDEDDDSEDDDSEDDDEDDALEVDGPTCSEIVSLFGGPFDWLVWSLPPGLTSEELHKAGGVMKTALTEEHFGALHWIDQVPKTMIQFWEGKSNNDDSNFNIVGEDKWWYQVCQNDNIFKLPPHNDYIPSDLSLIFTPTNVETPPLPQNNDQISLPPPLPTSSSETPADGVTPSLLVSKDGCRVWHYTDKRFPVPKANLIISLASYERCNTLRSAILTVLLQQCLKDSTAEMRYMAEMAELYSSVGLESLGLQLAVQGFSDKAPTLFLGLLKILLSGNFINEDCVPRSIEKTLKSLANDQFKVASRANSNRVCSLIEMHYVPEDALQELEHLISDIEGNSSSSSSLSSSFEVLLRKHLQQYLSSLCVDVLVHGNISEAVTTQVYGEISNMFDNYKCQLSNSHYPITKVSKLISGKPSVLAMASRNLSESNICMSLYYQYNRDQDKNEMIDKNKEYTCECRVAATLDLIEQLLEEPMFDELRTKQQLGYSVDITSRNTQRILGLSLMVVSSEFSIAKVQLAMLKFLRTSGTYIRNMPSDAFAANIDTTITQLLSPAQNLNEAADILWSNIEDRSFHFTDRMERANFLLQEKGKKTNSLISQDACATFLENLVGDNALLLAVQITSKGLSSPIFMPIERPVSTKKGKGKGNGRVTTKKKSETVKVTSKVHSHPIALRDSLQKYSNSIDFSNIKILK